MVHRAPHGSLHSKPSPGQPNAYGLFTGHQTPSLDIGPIPFTPNNDGKDDFYSIRCVLPASYSATVAIYGFNGKKYCDVPMGLQPQYLWDGKTSNATAAPVGPFFVVCNHKKTGLKPLFCGKKGFYGDKPVRKDLVQVVHSNKRHFPLILFFPFFIMAVPMTRFPPDIMGNSGAHHSSQRPFGRPANGSRPVFSPIPCASVFRVRHRLL